VNITPLLRIVLTGFIPIINIFLSYSHSVSCAIKLDSSIESRTSLWVIFPDPINSIENSGSFAPSYFLVQRVFELSKFL